jgi:hypothetical protein
MKQYIGTKLINAVPMTRFAYNQFRGWDLPANENGDDEGYLVEYLDGGTANTEKYAGYVSWSPKGVFENAYRPTDGMPFGHAVECLKEDYKVERAGWNGKGMWLRYVSKSPLMPSHRAFIEMKTVDDEYVPWVASQTDILADDWRIVR